MRNLKRILLISFLICLSSCQTVEPINNEQCSAHLSFIIEGDKRIIDEENSFCVCRMYKHSKQYIGSTGGDEIRDISYCNNLIGYTPDDYLEIFNFKEDVRQFFSKK